MMFHMKYKLSLQNRCLNLLDSINNCFESHCFLTVNSISPSFFLLIVNVLLVFGFLGDISAHNE